MGGEPGGCRSRSTTPMEVEPVAESEALTTIEPTILHRVVADPAALDGAAWPAEWTVARTAADEALVLGPDRPTPPSDDAIILTDTSWATAVVTAEHGAEIMRRHANWPPPTSGLAQGAVAAIGVKLIVEPGRWRFLVQSAFALDFADRVLGEESP